MPLAPVDSTLAELELQVSVKGRLMPLRAILLGQLMAQTYFKLHLVLVKPCLIQKR